MRPLPGLAYISVAHPFIFLKPVRGYCLLTPHPLFLVTLSPFSPPLNKGKGIQGIGLQIVKRGRKIFLEEAEHLQALSKLTLN